MVIGSKKMCTSTNQVMMTETVTVALDLWMLHPHLITLTSLHIYLSHTIADLYDIFKIQLQTSTTSPMTSGASYLLLASLYSGPWYESPSSCHPYKNPHYVHNPSIWFQVYLTFYLSFLVTNDNIYWAEKGGMGRSSQKPQKAFGKWNESTGSNKSPPTEGVNGIQSQSKDLLSTTLHNIQNRYWELQD